MTAQFRIGGVYRNVSGKLQRIIGPSLRPNPERHYFQVSLLAEDGTVLCSDDGARFINGSYFGDPAEGASLLPGELHNVNGQWVPVAEEAPKTERLDVFEDYCGPDVDGSYPEPRFPGDQDFSGGTESQRAPLAYRKEEKDRAVFDPFCGFFTEPADMADWQDTYFPC